MNCSLAGIAPWQRPFHTRLLRVPTVLHLGEDPLPRHFNEVRLFHSTLGTSENSLAGEDVNSEENKSRRRSLNGESIFFKDFVAGRTENAPVKSLPYARGLQVDRNTPKSRSSKSSASTSVRRSPSQLWVAPGKENTRRPPLKSPGAEGPEEFADLKAKISGSSKSTARSDELVSAPSAEQVAMEEFAALELKLAGKNSAEPGAKPAESGLKPKGSVLVGITEPRAPKASECCGNGCANCVWIEYWERLQEWEEAQAKAKDDETPP